MDPETLAFEELDDPCSNIPDEGQQALMEIWKGDLRLYNNHIKDRMEAAKQAYAVVLGQCSQPVRDRLTMNPGRHRPDGPPPTDPTMSVHQRNKEERRSLITRRRGSAVPFQARRTHVQP